jgi:hypothetical protein
MDGADSGYPGPEQGARMRRSVGATPATSNSIRFVGHAKLFFGLNKHTCI